MARPETLTELYGLVVMLMAAAVPLAMRKVPVNRFYGFRTPKTRSSPEIWFRANEKAGVNLLAAGAFTLAAWAAIRLMSGAATYHALAAPVMATAFVVCLAVSFVQLQRM